jgi:Fic family protein
MSLPATYPEEMSQKSRFGDTSSRPAWRPDVPHDDLPPLPPPIDLETRPVLKACVGARAALGELKQAATLLPNPTILINTLPLLEAQASSEIEQIVTTTDQLFRFAGGGDAADPPTKEALRYRHALLDGFASLKARPLCTATAELVCTRIKDALMQVRKVPGTALANHATAEVIYTPPEGEDRIRGLLANWERFLHGEDAAGDLDPLVRMAAAHYQFEAIHPFADGNGRTGRVLNSLFLVEQGLLPLPILYLSRFIIAHKADYYSLLLGVTRDAAWEPWTLFMLRGIGETAAWTTKKIEAIRQLMAVTVDHVRNTSPKIYSRELVDLVFEQPYCRIANVVEAGIAGRQAASRYLQALVSSGLLREQEAGREKLFVNSRLLWLLTTESDSIEPFPNAPRKR